MVGGCHYAKFKLTLPSKPELDFIEFAEQLCREIDKLTAKEIVMADFPLDFSESVFLNHFTMKRNTQLRMSFLTEGAKKLRFELLLDQLLVRLKEKPDDTSIQKSLTDYGVAKDSIAFEDNDSISYIKHGVKVNIKPDVEILAIISKLYTKYLNPMAERITFAFNPTL